MYARCKIRAFNFMEPPECMVANRHSVEGGREEIQRVSCEREKIILGGRKEIQFLDQIHYPLVPNQLRNLSKHFISMSCNHYV